MTLYEGMFFRGKKTQRAKDMRRAFNGIVHMFMFSHGRNDRCWSGTGLLFLYYWVWKNSHCLSVTFSLLRDWLVPACSLFAGLWIYRHVNMIYGFFVGCILLCGIFWLITSIRYVSLTNIYHTISLVFVMICAIVFYLTPLISTVYDYVWHSKFIIFPCHFFCYSCSFFAYICPII